MPKRRMMLPRQRNHAATLASSLLVSLLVVGCGSSGEPTITASAIPSTTSTATATSKKQPPTTPVFANTVSGTTSDQQGDSAEITVGVGSPQPLEKLSDPIATACNQEITNSGQSLGSAVAIPLRFTTRLTSSLKVPLAVLGKANYLNVQKQEVEPATNDTAVPILWAVSYSNTGPVCRPSGELGEGPEVTWSAETITPNVPNTSDSWLILVKVITPNDSSGSETVDRVLIWPGASVGSQPTNGDLTPRGSGWVRCSVFEASVHLESYLAVDPASVKANGCSAR
jgi:hypothetical protein